MSWNVPPDDEREISPAGEARDPERSKREAARRAATMMRRYAVANRCDRMWTLTYAPKHLPEDLGQAWERDASRFRDRLYALVGERFPILMVPERGGESDRLHFHFITNRYLPMWLVDEAWESKGLLWAKRRDRTQIVNEDGEIEDRAAPTGGRARARLAAGYLSSYLKKGMLDGHEFGRHRYSTTRGFASQSRSFRFSSQRAARAWCSLTIRGVLVREWRSDDVPSWDGPPVWLGFYEDDPLGLGGGP